MEAVMSHKVQTMVSGSGIKPWHGLGTIVEGMMTSKECIEKAGLSWQVSKVPVEYSFKKDTVNVKHEKYDGKFIVVREDNGVGLGCVGGVYTPMQNREAFSMIDELVGTKEVCFETAGALGQGERVWMAAKVQGLITVRGVDPIEKYLFLSNSFDGKHLLSVGLTGTRIVCANTLQIATTEANKTGDIFKIRHSAKMGEKVEAAREALGIINNRFEDFEALANRLARVQVNTARLNEFIDQLGFDADAEKGRQKGIVDDIKRAFESSPGSNLVSAKGTMWGAVNSISYLTTHERSTRVTSAFKSEEEARFAASLWGSGDALNQKALQVATQMSA